MEDRQPTGLILEMLHAEPAAPRSAVRAWQREETRRALQAGVATRAAYFENLRPGEDRFPNTVGEFEHLTVYEVGDPDVAGAWARAHEALSTDAVGGVRLLRRLMFRRYPRPSQGRVTPQTSAVFLILISPTEPARAQELRDWADFTHIHHIAAASPEGFTTITPYENVDGGEPRFLHLYELDADDPVKAVDAMPEAVIRRWGFGMGDPGFMRWAIHDALKIDYVNVFGRATDLAEEAIA